MAHRRPAHHGFTVIELIVVVGVLAVLMGLILPALGGVRKRARKTEELNNIREVGKAWNLYANQNNDAALPGFIDGPSQMDWKVKFKYQDKTTIEEGPAAPWTWRLAPFLDYNPETLIGYDTEGVEDPMGMKANAGAVSVAPSFGYNGYHLGGYWRLAASGGEQRPIAWFSQSEVADTPGKQAAVVARNISTVQRASEVVAFCAASNVGQVGLINKIADDIPGYHLVCSPFFGTEQVWGNPAPPGGGGEVTGGFGDQTMVEIFNLQPVANHLTGVPIGRHTGATTVFRVDGSSDTPTPGSLADQRAFIDKATSKDWQVADDSL